MSTTTTNKVLTKPAYNDLNWDVPTNANWDGVDSAFGGSTTVSLTSSNVTLTTTQTQPMNINFTGTITANIAITFPTVGGVWVITNNTTGAFTLTCKSAYSGSVGVVVEQGKTSFIYSNAQEIYFADNRAISGAAPLNSPTFTGTPAAPTPATSNNSTQLATTAFVLAAIAAYGNGVLTGTITGWSTTTAPTGYLECNGAAVSRTTYAALFAVIGTVWGAGNGTTTFNLPDLRGAFFRGWDNGRGLDSGRAFASYQADTFQDHTHNYVNVSATAIARAAGDNSFVAIGSQFLAATSAAGSGNPGTETRPKNVAAMYIIKT